MDGRPKTIGVIPARLDSRRLPGKVLLPIGGKPMVQWVYERARRSDLLDELLVATDSPEVQRRCADCGIPAMLTGEHPSGSDRLYEVMERTDGWFYVNIQGDEPTIDAEHIDLVLGPLFGGAVGVSTLKVAIDAEAAQDPNCVKVVSTAAGYALYFSRHAVPFDRDGEGGVAYYKHIGLYGYTRAALERFRRLPQSPLERAEKLEQLRFLDNGIAIAVAEARTDTIGVDTAEDLERAQAFLLGGVQPPPPA
ncbi:MAG: 3-deoxy-manno-octulosonate cytidylyltransferase [Acidobacteriota bacterium]|jgi:3-deoxy-manno-octulosonate cytidylyltransferase (CMP-KDO synthetase)|nr:3-deoxy-manno-octulosonate cytidylyltransferase [Acidobacteriota bacterium]